MTIPVIAGVLNWATNQLAVWMIFNPLEFRGLPYLSRPRPGEPLGWGGWQVGFRTDLGCVTAKQ
jgi:hypothetical protein